jgi:hypothetical protein
MTPAGGERDNMVAWIAGRADAPEYGKLRVLRFPKDRTIFGPLQVEGRIDNDATIRQQLSLLCPSGNTGTTCQRGNLLVLPVGSSFIYIKPLFIQSSQVKIPELQRIILATQDKVVMADSFANALDLLFATGTTPTPTPAPTPGPSGTPRPSGAPTATPAPSQTVAQLVKQASDHYDQAQAALKRGDFPEYARLITLLQDDLAKLRAATGQ